jgi:2-keto-3-deoxy-galactonokinase
MIHDAPLARDVLQTLSRMENAFVEGLVGGLPVLSAARHAGFRFQNEDAILSDPRLRAIIKAVVSKLIAFVRAAPEGAEVYGSHIISQRPREHSQQLA